VTNGDVRTAHPANVEISREGVVRGCVVTCSQTTRIGTSHFRRGRTHLAANPEVTRVSIRSAKCEAWTFLIFSDSLTFLVEFESYALDGVV
jgi:hypothetical protein